MNPPHRPWYQFSLRTMLIVMVLASAGFGYWVHWSRVWIRQRHEALESRLAIPAIEDTVRPWVPGGLWLFGEKGASVIYIPGSKCDVTDEENEAKVRVLFPEAKVIMGPTW